MHRKVRSKNKSSLVRERIAIIGAGVSGLALARVALEKGYQVFMYCAMGKRTQEITVNDCHLGEHSYTINAKKDETTNSYPAVTLGRHPGGFFNVVGIEGSSSMSEVKAIAKATKTPLSIVIDSINSNSLGLKRLSTAGDQASDNFDNQVIETCQKLGYTKMPFKLIYDDDEKCIFTQSMAMVDNSISRQLKFVDKTYEDVFTKATIYYDSPAITATDKTVTAIHKGDTIVRKYDHVFTATNLDNGRLTGKKLMDLVCYTECRFSMLIPDNNVMLSACPQLANKDYLIQIIPLEYMPGIGTLINFVIQMKIESKMQVTPGTTYGASEQASTQLLNDKNRPLYDEAIHICKAIAVACGTSLLENPTGSSMKKFGATVGGGNAITIGSGITPGVNSYNNFTSLLPGIDYSLLPIPIKNRTLLNSLAASTTETALYTRWSLDESPE